jgi:hypothetical protein
MRDKKRKEKKLLEEAYYTVNENCMGLEPEVMITQEPIQAVNVDIATLAAQAIAAIAELATAAGANLSVTVETEQEDELPVGQFNTGYENVEET